jgi:hypothetical protein
MSLISETAWPICFKFSMQIPQVDVYQVRSNRGDSSNFGILANFQNLWISPLLYMVFSHWLSYFMYLGKLASQSETELIFGLDRPTTTTSSPIILLGWPESHLTFEGNFKVVHHKMLLISETTCHRVKISNIWAPWAQVASVLTVWRTRVTFDLSRLFQCRTSQNVTYLGNCLS